jgi:hypothetical protein
MPKAYLQVPTIFDEFSKWPSLPAALEGFLEGMMIRQPHLSLLPLHFILQDSIQANVTKVASSQGVLYRYEMETTSYSFTCDY